MDKQYNNAPKRIFMYRGEKMSLWAMLVMIRADRYTQ